MPSPHGFGTAAFGTLDFGNGYGVVVHHQTSSGLPITATLARPASIGLPLTASLQHAGFAGLSVWALVVPAKLTISVNGNSTIPKPNSIQYGLQTNLGPDLSGTPTLQGYSTMVWNYPNLPDDDVGLLMALYDPQNPEVTLVYPNELGFWVQAKAMLQPPALGTRTTVESTNLQLIFTHIIPA